MSIKSNDPLLKNLQANIVKGHGRDIAFHLFFQFKQGNEIAIRNWISNFAKTELTTAAEQIADTEVFKEANEENDKPVADALRKKPVFTLSLSAHGYKTLGLSTQMPDSTVFKAGMRGNAQKLGDKERDIEECFTHQIDMMILVAVDAPDIAEGKADDIIKQLNGIAIIVKKQRGNVLKMLGTNVGIEHFGYADGVSQPLYLEDDILDQPPISQWDDEEATDILLVEDFFDNSTDAKCYGSYLVFRKLEQDVSEFKAREEKIPPVKRSLGQSDDELAGAMIVGRFEDGSPVTDFDKAVHFVTNDFDYSTDMAGSKCPYHSHIRLVNPRNGLTPGSDFRKHRITRRGMPFDNNTAGNKRIEDQSITCITEKFFPTTFQIGRAHV